MKKLKIAVVNGPNINLTGKREPEIYGYRTLDDLNRELTELAGTLDTELVFFQSNSEGAIIDYLQKASDSCDGIILNPAAYTHTSVAIRDAVSASALPVIEVHFSNIFGRESFRAESLTASVCTGQICGLGFFSYKAALMGLTDYIRSDRA